MVKMSSENISKSKLNYGSLVRQLFVLNMSILLCWLPADIMYISLYFISHYPKILILLIPVTFGPITALVFPTLYILIHIRTKFSRKERVTTQYICTANLECKRHPLKNRCQQCGGVMIAGSFKSQLTDYCRRHIAFLDKPLQFYANYD